MYNVYKIYICDQYDITDITCVKFAFQDEIYKYNVYKYWFGKSLSYFGKLVLRLLFSMYVTFNCTNFLYQVIMQNLAF